MFSRTSDEKPPDAEISRVVKSGSTSSSLSFYQQTDMPASVLKRQRQYCMQSKSMPACCPVTIKKNTVLMQSAFDGDSFVAVKKTCREQRDREVHRYKFLTKSEKSKIVL